MSKKTAIDLMAKELLKNITELCGCETRCPAFSKYCMKHNVSDKTCIKRIKQHFQQQADIPDGWEVVKEIYENAECGRRLALDGNFGHKTMGEKLASENAFYSMAHLTKDKLQQAGIEVEDV